MPIVPLAIILPTVIVVDRWSGVLLNVHSVQIVSADVAVDFARRASCQEDSATQVSFTGISFGDEFGWVVDRLHQFFGVADNDSAQFLWGNSFALFGEGAAGAGVTA